MTDETKPEAMTAERMDTIRYRARHVATLYGGGATATLLAAEDVPALLSALEEARAQAAAELDARRAVEANLEASEQNAEANLELAQQREHERDALAATLAEIVTAFDAGAGQPAAALPALVRTQVNQARALAARVATLERQLEERKQRVGELHKELNERRSAYDAGVDIAIENQHRDIERAEQAAARVAELEGALATERARTEGLREALMLQMSYLAHQDQDADHAWMAKKMREDRDASFDPSKPLPAAPPEKAPALPWPVTANALHALSLAFPDVESNSIDNVCGAFTIAECLADSLDRVTCVACLREIARARAPKAGPALPTTSGEGAPAGVTIHGGPEAARWLATPADELLDAPAADPLCARDLGGQPCGRPRSLHGPIQPDGFAELCLCPGFVPESVATPALSSERCSACGGSGAEGTGQPNGEGGEEFRECSTCDGSGEVPCVPEPSGVVDHGTDRTCGTCGGNAVCTLPMGSGADCPLWSPKSGGSTTEGGETP